MCTYCVLEQGLKPQLKAAIRKNRAKDDRHDLQCVACCSNAVSSNTPVQEKPMEQGNHLESSSDVVESGKR